MKVRPEDYLRMRDWFSLVSERAFPPQLMADAQPVAHLDKLAERSPAKAREGLSMGISDLVEITDGWSAQEVQALDAELVGTGLPTLTEMRARFSKAVRRVVKRGRINDEAEYHAVRNAAELAENAEGALWSLLAAYEKSAAP